MKNRPLPNDEQLLDLLAQCATEGLDAQSTMALQRELAQVDDDAVDVDGLELAAAALEVGLLESTDQVQPMPESLMARITEQGEAAMQVAAENVDSIPIDAGRPKSPTSANVAAGWIVAAAAVVVAIAAWMMDLSGTAAQPTAAEQRLALIDQADDVITVKWDAPANPQFAQVSGDVVWSDKRQSGYMRLVGMPINNPDQLQYQLWIVDPGRDKFPVDGGVFDITARGEVIVPIRAKLAVDQPTIFAITLEKPGGVVVSDGPLEIVAAIKSG